MYLSSTDTPSLAVPPEARDGQLHKAEMTKINNSWNGGQSFHYFQTVWTLQRHYVAGQGLIRWTLCEAQEQDQEWISDRKWGDLSP